MRNLSLLTDLYELTMMQGFVNSRIHNRKAVFDVFFRQMSDMSYAVCAGLEQAIDYVKNIHFLDEDIEYLRGLNLFTEEFLDMLKNYKFSGDIYAIPEGTVVFASEPLLTVKTTLFEAQLIETALLNIINHQTLIATKATRISHSAKGKPVMEFGLRRAQGPDAGIYGARAAMIGGCCGTSNVLAGQMFDVPVLGTHAHSWVMSFKDELTAFRAYADLYPDACTLLVDTYDTLKSGLPNAITVFNELKAKGHTPKGIRIDSGDLAYLTKKARKMLDEAGFPEVKICVSGDIDEHVLLSLNAQDACIDSYGIGTKLITSHSHPSLGGVYKLAEVENDEGELIPKLKVSDTSEKITNPGYKTVWRIYTDGRAAADLIALKEEKFDKNKPLTLFHPIETWKKITFTDYEIKELSRPIILNGELVYEFPKVSEIISFAKQSFSEIWEEYKRLTNPHIYKVDLSDKLYELKKRLLSEAHK